MEKKRYITENLIELFIEKNKRFENEYDFQFEFAYYLRNKYPDINIGVEKNVYDNSNEKNCRCDIVGKCNNEIKLLVELKYVLKRQTSCGSRKSFIKNIKRLKNLKNYKNAEKYCIFLTDKPAVRENIVSASEEIGEFNICNKENLWNWNHLKFQDDAENEDISFIIINPDEWEISK